ncbi:MAG TPA: hypothetical protein VGO56_04205 [Pyrinomonadaceae bacterium]|jgi:hypothetical protein|nr:hypothetical protein [Pyrinomonadaceae bacterium]
MSTSREQYKSPDAGVFQLGLPLVDSYEAPSLEESESMLDYLLAYPSRLLRDFLRASGIPPFLTKPLSRERLLQKLKNGEVDAADIITQLDELEGWGDQHIFLYHSTLETAKRWSSEAGRISILQKNGLDHLLNRRNPCVLPLTPVISTIRGSNDRLRIQWVEQRVWDERLPQLDQVDGAVTLRAYHQRVRRGVTTFDWDLVTGHAALMIERLPHGTNYLAVRDRFESELESVVGISTFKRIRLSKATGRIEESGEARRRQYKHETERGYVASFTSPSPLHDAFEDPGVERARKALGKTVSLLGNLYWNPVSGKLDRHIHVKLYPKERRVGIFGACTELEVRHLLSRIRFHCH